MPAMLQLAHGYPWAKLGAQLVQLLVCVMMSLDPFIIL
jgi:hypothetical protein